MPTNQVVIIGKRSFPITYGGSGPSITGVFTPEQKRFITRVYGVKIVDAPVPVGTKPSSKR